MKKSMLVLSLMIAGCGRPMEYSPWQTNVSYHDLTAKNLARLDNQNGPFAPFKIALMGDPQAVIEHLQHAGEVINERGDIDFVAIAGDISDRGLKTEFDWVGDVLSKYNKPVVTVVGNHDGLANGKAIYNKMFGPFNYSFIYKDIKFVMWNNNAYEWSVDMDWLEAEVNSYDKVVVIAHQPPGDTAFSETDEARWAEIRKSPNLIASLHGHVHHYNFRHEGDLPIYTVDRVTGTHYGVISFDYDKIDFYNCTPVCKEIE